MHNSENLLNIVGLYMLTEWILWYVNEIVKKKKSMLGLVHGAE